MAKNIEDVACALRSHPARVTPLGRFGILAREELGGDTVPS